MPATERPSLHPAPSRAQGPLPHEIEARFNTP